VDRAALIADFIVGLDEPGAVALARDALDRWSRSDGGIPLERFFGLRTPADFRRDARNRFLREAYALAGTIGALAAAVRAFEGHTWQAWSKGTLAPRHSSPINAALFYARKRGVGPLPKSAKQLGRIVMDTESEKRVPALAA
jgi:hypothetical protein